MDVNPLRTRFAPRLAVCVMLPAFALALGCDDNSAVRTYDAPKDTSAPQPVAGAAKPAAAEEPPIEWKVPEGWKRMPDRQMRYATFQVDPSKPDVELTVVPLPLAANPLLANVNRWEGQLGLPNTSEGDLAKIVTKIDLPPDAAAEVVDLTGKDAKSGAPARLLGARVGHDDQAWFFKLMGPVEVVAAQKSNFEAFLRSVEFHHDHEGHDHKHDGHDHAHDKADNVKLAWETLPDGWTEEKGDKPFRAHTIKVQQGGEVADLAISKLKVEQAGGLMDNINRWRTSVGLEPTQDPAAHQAKNAVVGGQPGFRIDVKGAEKSVAVGMTSVGDQLWFFKLTGPNKLMDLESGAFDTFLRSAKFAPAAGDQPK